LKQGFFQKILALFTLHKGLQPNARIKVYHWQGHATKAHITSLALATENLSAAHEGMDGRILRRSAGVICYKPSTRDCATRRYVIGRSASTGSLTDTRSHPDLTLPAGNRSLSRDHTWLGWQGNAG